MIDCACGCGKRVELPESEAGKVHVCGQCGAWILLVAGEELPPEAGLGDFDAVLEVESGLSGGLKRIQLGGVTEISVGRLPQNQIVLAAPGVSKIHAKLLRVDFGPSRWKIIDAGSTYGVSINGQKVQEAELKEGDEIRIGQVSLRFGYVAVPAVATPPVAPPVQAGGPVCPSCGKVLPPKTKMCVTCGIDLKTGRSVAVSREFDENDLAIRSDTWIRIISVFLPFGLYPVASEAMGLRKPVAAWAIVGLTFVCSVAFFIASLGSGRENADVQNLMLWSGTPSAQNDAAEEQKAYEKLKRFEEKLPANMRSTDAELRDAAKEMVAEKQDALPEGVGFRWWQPLTCAFLHAGLMHFAGNMLFLIVFGIRVNEMIGNLKFAILYPVLAVSSSLINLWMVAGGAPHAMLGASGAIMGLAGMYLVLFPIQRVYMAIWLRIWFGFRTWCGYKVFPMRGFWLLGLWVALNDVLPVVLKLRGDGVAHWAHLGGLIAGFSLASALLIARLTDAGGTDLYSVCLGKAAWAIIGKPSDRAAKGEPLLEPMAGQAARR